MSAVILLVIVIAWAVVLVPTLLRRHDAVSESRSVDRFEKAMRVLSRKPEPAGAAREVVMPRRTAAATVTVNGTTAWSDAPVATREALLRTRDAAAIPALSSQVVPSSPSSQPAPSSQRALPSQPALPSQDAPSSEAAQRGLDTSTSSRRLARCRRTLLVLAVLPLPLLAAALLVSPWLWSIQAAADVALAGFVVHLRQESARRQARRERRALLARRAKEAEREGASTAVQVRPPAWSSSSAYARAATPPERLRQSVAESTEVVIEKQSDGSWLPVPVPVPTYVTAPPAPPRRATTAAEPVEQRPDPTEQQAEPQVEAIGAQRRKAVNE